MPYNIPSGATSSGIHVAYTSMTVNSGGRAVNCTIEQGGCLYVAAGGTATNLTVIPGAVLQIRMASNTYEAGKYDGSSFEIKNGRVSGYNIAGYLAVGTGCVASDTTAGTLYVNSGGKAINTKYNS